MKIILFCLSRGVTTGGRGKVSPTFFQKLEKSVIALTVVILGYISQLKYGFKNFQEKKTQFFPCGAFLSCMVDQMFIEVPWFQENTPALKNSGYVLA